MTIVDPSLRFWLGYAEQRGALTEDAGWGSAVVVLPETLQRTLDLPEEVAVTADPDAARDDGALLLVPGQPVLDVAADAVLTEGDARVSWLAWPASARPSRHDLVAAARERFSIDHGRIDAGGEPAPVLFPLLRVGALITYTMSLDLRFQEREEVWVDARTGQALDERVRRLAASGATEPAPTSPRRELSSDLVGAFSAAHGLFDTLATARLRQLAGHADDARRRQLDAADAYYRDALASVARRRSTASAERRALLDAQEEATRVERSRRVAEIEATFAPRHEVRPIRAHLVLRPPSRCPSTSAAEPGPTRSRWRGCSGLPPSPTSDVRSARAPRLSSPAASGWVVVAACPLRHLCPIAMPRSAGPTTKPAIEPTALPRHRRCLRPPRLAPGPSSRPCPPPQKVRTVRPLGQDGPQP